MNLYDNTSLASRLPTEILCHIFTYSLPQIGYLSPKSQASPLLLTRICRRWRDISVNMPSLWCRLSIVVDQENLQQWSFCYDSWLKRTRGHPLSLEIPCFVNDSTFLQPLLRPYIHQVSSLNVTFCNAVAPEKLLDDLPALQVLRIDTTMDSPISQEYYTLQSILPPISRLSSLHTLECEGIFCFTFDLLPKLNPALSRLSNLAIYQCERRVVLRVLQLAPNLSSLKICGVFDNGHHLEPLTHTSIQSLSITPRHPRRSGSRMRTLYPRDLITPILNALTLPNLRVLNVGARSWTGEELKAVGSCTVGLAIGL
ncbi:hypothetical protein EDB19DRAFT_1043408 [Suillus lakei]|nr:hypothetical protein EDB19DRAFT_1043408 [Suillus lakei]